MPFVITTLLLCLVESIFKGWWSLLLVPASAVVLPIEYFIQRYAHKMSLREPRLRGITSLRIAQLIALLTLYVTVVGFGDSESVLLFGFVESTNDSPVAKISTALCAISLFAVVILTVLLIARLVFLRTAHEKSFTPDLVAH
jgi:hypothetical protein